MGIIIYISLITLVQFKSLLTKPLLIIHYMENLVIVQLKNLLQELSILLEMLEHLNAHKYSLLQANGIL